MISSNWGRLLVSFAVLSLIAPAEARQAQGRRPSLRSRINQAIKNVQKEIKELEKELQSTQQEYRQAELELARAYATYKQASQDLDNEEKALQGRIGPTVGLPEAMAAHETALQAYERATAAVETTLQQDPEYRKLVQHRDETEARLKSLRKDRADDGKAESDAIQKAAKEAHAARQALHNRMDRDPSVQPTVDAKHTADEKLKAARQKFQAATKEDATLKRADKFLKQARNEWRQAQAHVARLEVKIAALQEQLAADHLMIGR